jgi:UDP-GlcNAc3NAcA epimerase
MTLKIVSVVGARPQFVKAAALSRAIAAREEIKEIMIHTGQHFDHGMSDIFFEELAIPLPKYNLDIHGSQHGDMTGRMLIGIEAILLDEKPDMMLVYGDTNSTLAGALAASKLSIPVIHVEAGLRSFNRAMPEEINRVLTDHVSALLLCPTKTAVDNLKNEGITSGVFETGDVMMDATLYAKELATTRSTILQHLNLSVGDYSLATIHRPANTDDPAALANVVAFLHAQAKIRAVVLPLHPRTKAAAMRHNISLEGLLVIDPVGYLDMTQLTSGCVEVFTDSGGLQKEAYFHAKPCVTLRDETEWVETINAGWNRLWTNPNYLPRMPISEYGTGHASEIIVKLILGAAKKKG